MTVKTLIINCHVTEDRPKIVNYVNWVKEFSEIFIVPDDGLHEGLNMDSYDALILTGSRKFASKNEVNEELLKLIREASKPMLGVCYGHQIICKVLGCEVVYRPRQIKGMVNVEIVDENELFRGFEREASFVESHFDHVVLDEKLFDRLGLELLARSDSCDVEAIKWTRKPFYGVQFHPEVSGRNGEKIAENFYRYVVRR